MRLFFWTFKKKKVAARKRSEEKRTERVRIRRRMLL